MMSVFFAVLSACAMETIEDHPLPTFQVICDQMTQLVEKTLNTSFYQPQQETLQVKAFLAKKGTDQLILDKKTRYKTLLLFYQSETLVPTHLNDLDTDNVSPNFKTLFTGYTLISKNSDTLIKDLVRSIRALNHGSEKDAEKILSSYDQDIFKDL